MISVQVELLAIRTARENKNKNPSAQHNQLSWIVTNAFILQITKK